MVLLSRRSAFLKSYAALKEIRAGTAGIAGKTSQVAIAIGYPGEVAAGGNPDESGSGGVIPFHVGVAAYLREVQVAHLGAAFLRLGLNLVFSLLLDREQIVPSCGESLIGVGAARHGLEAVRRDRPRKRGIVIPLYMDVCQHPDRAGALSASSRAPQSAFFGLRERLRP